MTDTTTHTETDAETGTDAETNTDADTTAGTEPADATGTADDADARTAVLAGPDDDALGVALEEAGIEIERIAGIANRAVLEDAGITDTALFVLTDARQATAIPVAKDLNPSLRVVVYARDSLPEFARGQADLLVDPDLLEPATVAEELAA